MKAIFQILKEKDLINKNGPKESRIRSIPINEIADISIKIEKYIENNQQPSNSRIFTHSASTSLAARGCNFLDHRLPIINQLARFALMYSEKVYMCSYFADYLNPDLVKDPMLARKAFFEDLIIINEIRDLVEKGFMEFFSPIRNICYACRAKELLGKKPGKSFSQQIKILESDYYNTTEIECYKKSGNYVIDCSSPRLHHNVRTYFKIPPEPLVKRPTILSKVDQGDTVHLSKSLSKEFELHVHFAHGFADDILMGLMASANLNTSFLTDNEFHVSFLNSLNSDKNIRNRNNIVANHLTSLVPFVEEVPLKNLIKLRNREEDAFITYRLALNTAIETVLSSKDNFTGEDARSIYADIIDPNLAELEKKINMAKKGIVSKPLRSLVSNSNYDFSTTS